MSATVWYFLRAHPGDLRPLAQRTLEAFLSNYGRLQADAEGFVRYAEVIVNLENRRAVAIVRVGFFQVRALKDGTLDRKHFAEVMAAVPEAAIGSLGLSKKPTGVIDAEHRFAKRRLEHLNRWKPTPAELSKLRSLVNQKAGREIMGP